MSLGYFDTSALMRWVENDVPAPTARNIHVAAQVALLRADPTATLGVSGLTLLELRSVICQDWRSTHADDAAFDADWARASNLGVMREVSTGRFVVVPVPPKAPEHAATLFDLATSQHGIALGAWDAIHLITAAAWAYREGQVVSLYTCDDDFQRFVDHYGEFSRFVRIVDMNP